LVLNVTIPANTTATIEVPTSDPGSVTEGGKAMAPVGGKAVYSVGSGSYHFESAM
jgi:alpha-L-rhamnosidase